MKAVIKHLTSSVLPGHHQYFTAWPKNISSFQTQGPQKCMLGIGWRATSTRSALHADMCLRTITTGNGKPPCEATATSTKEEEMLVSNPVAAVTMTVIREGDVHMGASGGLCCASGRLVFKTRHSPDGGNLYFRDYFTRDGTVV
jgi:hypothetical protein